MYRLYFFIGKFPLISLYEAKTGPSSKIPIKIADPHPKYNKKFIFYDFQAQIFQLNLSGRDASIPRIQKNTVVHRVLMRYFIDEGE